MGNINEMALDKKESKIVRVNSIQGLFDLLSQYPVLQNDFDNAIQELPDHNIPSITARIKKLKKIISKFQTAGITS